MCYAARFLQSGFYPMEVVPPEAPPTPDRIFDSGTLEPEWEEKNTDVCAVQFFRHPRLFLSLLMFNNHFGVMYSFPLQPLVL